MSIPSSPDDAVFRVSDSESTLDWEEEGDVIHSSLSQNASKKTAPYLPTCENAESADIFSTSVVSEDLQLTLEGYANCSRVDDLDNTTYLEQRHKDSDQSDVCENAGSVKCTTEFSETIDNKSYQELSSSFTSGLSSTFTCNDTGVDIQALTKAQTAFDPHHLRTLESAKVGEKHQCFLAGVVDKHPVKEIWLKNRRCWVAMGVVVLRDATGMYRKLIMWAENCKHSFNIHFGDVLFLSEVTVKKCFGDIMLCMTGESVLINLGYAKHLVNLKECTDLGEGFLRPVNDISKWFIKHHPVCSFEIVRNFLWTESLQTNELDLSDKIQSGQTANVNVYIMGVKHRKSDIHKSPILVYVSNLVDSGHFLPLVLHGSASEWVRKLTRFHVYKWRFTNLVACDQADTGNPELHTTIFSSADCLFDSEPSKIDTNKHPEAKSYYELVKYAENGCNRTILLKNLKIHSLYSCALAKRVTRRSSFKNRKLWIDDLQSCPEKNIFYVRCSFMQDTSKYSFKVCCDQSTLAHYVLKSSQQDFNAALLLLDGLLENTLSCKATVTMGLDRNDISLGPSVIITSFTM